MAVGGSLIFLFLFFILNPALGLVLLLLGVLGFGLFGWM